MSAKSSRGSRWDKLRGVVLDRDNRTCTACGKGPLIGDDATVDHIVAKDNGGPDELWNLTTLCRSCNSTKGARVLVRQNWFNRKYLERL